MLFALGASIGLWAVGISVGSAAQSLEQSYAEMCPEARKSSETCVTLRKALIAKLNAESSGKPAKPVASTAAADKPLTKAQKAKLAAPWGKWAELAGNTYDFGEAVYSYEWKIPYEVMTVSIESVDGKATSQLTLDGDAIVTNGKDRTERLSASEYVKIEGSDRWRYVFVPGGRDTFVEKLENGQWVQKQEPFRMRRVPEENLASVKSRILTARMAKAQEVLRRAELERTRDATPQDFAGTWMAKPDPNYKESTFTYVEISVDPSGTLKIWEGWPGLTGMAQVNPDVIGNINTMSLGPPDAQGRRVATYRSSGEDFPGGSFVLQGRTLRQVQPTSIYGTTVTRNFTFVDRNTLTRSSVHVSEGKTSPYELVFKKIDGPKRNDAVKLAASYNGKVMRGVEARLASQQAASETEGGAGLLGALGGAIVGVFAGGDTEQVIGAAMKGAAIADPNSELAQGLNTAGDALITGDTSAIDNAMGTSSLGDVASTGGGGGGSGEWKGPVSMPGCDAVGVNFDNFKSAALSGGNDVQLKTLCGAAYNYYWMYRNAEKQGYSPDGADITWQEHAKAAAVVNEFYAGARTN